MSRWCFWWDFRDAVRSVPIRARCTTTAMSIRFFCCLFANSVRRASTSLLPLGFSSFSTNLDGGEKPAARSRREADLLSGVDGCFTSVTSVLTTERNAEKSGQETIESIAPHVQHSTSPNRRDSDKLFCWQEKGELRLVPRSGITLGQEHSFALRTNGTVQCWESGYQGNPGRR